MNYQQAADTRKKGLFSAITDKLVAGQGIGSSVGGAISEKTQATVKGFKEKFDILNIAKTLTGGSNLAPALLGRLLGRKKEDIAYFSGIKSRKIGSLSSAQTNEMAVEVLGLIYREMLRTEAQRKIDFADAEEEKNKELEAEDTRNKQIIAALTGRKRPTKKVKVEKKKKEKKEKKSKAAGTVVPIGKKGVETISKLSPFKTIQKAVTKVVTPSRVAGGAILGGAAVMGVSNLAQAIGAAEAGGSYDVAFGDRENPKTGKITNVMSLPTAEEFAGKKLSEMTLEEVQKFQRARNAQKKNTGAVGKYQFVGSTLFGSKDRPGLVQRLGLSMDTKFTPQVQDQLNQMLFEDNVSALKRNGVPLTPGNLYMAHYIGAGGSAAVYRAAQKGENVTVAQALVNANLPDPSTQNKELTQIKAKDFEVVLQTRLEKKGLKISPEPSIPVKGTEIDVASKVNKDARAQADVSAMQQKNVSTTNTTNVSSSNQYAQNTEKEDDRSAYDKKVKQR
jgi:hypothetical protein